MNISDNSMAGKGSAVDHANSIFFNSQSVLEKKTQLGLRWIRNITHLSGCPSLKKKGKKKHREMFLETSNGALKNKATAHRG